MGNLLLALVKALIATSKVKPLTSYRICPCLTGQTQTECAPFPLPIREPTGLLESEKFVKRFIHKLPFLLLLLLMLRLAASICLKVRRPSCKAFKAK